MWVTWPASIVRSPISNVAGRQRAAAELLEEHVAGEEGVESGAKVSRAEQRGRLAVLLELDEVPQRDEVDVVVGVEVADDDGSQRFGRPMSRHGRERALAEIQRDGGLAVLDQVARRSPTRQRGVGGRRADDDQLHAVTTTGQLGDWPAASVSVPNARGRLEGGSVPDDAPHGPRISQTVRMPAADEG